MAPGAVKYEGPVTMVRTQAIDVLEHESDDIALFWVNAADLVMLRYDCEMQALCTPVLIATLGAWGGEWNNPTTSSHRIDHDAFEELHVLDSVHGTGALVVSMQQQQQQHTSGNKRKNDSAAGNTLLVRAVRMDVLAPEIEKVGLLPGAMVSLSPWCPSCVLFFSYGQPRPFWDSFAPDMAPACVLHHTMLCFHFTVQSCGHLCHLRLCGHSAERQNPSPSPSPSP
jgi:hypothetical protein